MLCYREMRKEDLARWEELAKSEFWKRTFVLQVICVISGAKSKVGFS